VQSLLLFTLSAPNLFHIITENLAFLAPDQQILKAELFWGMESSISDRTDTKLFSGCKNVSASVNIIKFDNHLGNTLLRISLGWYHFILLSISHDCSPTVQLAQYISVKNSPD